jgi:hypothetical protein
MQSTTTIQSPKIIHPVLYSQTKQDYIKLVKECIECDGEFADHPGGKTNRAIKCRTYRLDNDVAKKMAITEVAIAKDELINGILFSTDIETIAKTYGINIDELLNNSDAYKKFKLSCVALDGFYTQSDFLKSFSCRDPTDIQAGKVVTLPVAKAAAIRALQYILEKIKEYNKSTTMQPIKYMLFHAAGNPYSTSGLIKYYMTTFGFTLTYGVYPQLVYPDKYLDFIEDPNVTIDLIKNDYSKGKPLFKQNYERYMSLKKEYDAMVVQILKEPNGKNMLICKIQEYLDSLPQYGKTSPFQPLFIGSIDVLEKNLANAVAGAVGIATTTTLPIKCEIKMEQ